MFGFYSVEEFNSLFVHTVGVISRTAVSESTSC